MLVGVVQAVLKSALLLIFRDVQEELQNRCAVLIESVFKLVDLHITIVAGVIVDDAKHASCDNIFIVRAIEN